MLQQTQVATVLPYFARFIAAFPTVGSLARASEQRVLRLWQGLGYYRRARLLHAAARAIVREHGGAIPASLDALLQLPGVGRYTAGAVASIAFGVRAPLVDGNVARVLSRWFCVKGDDAAERLWRIADEMVPARSPGDFNQALMELGAMVCTPRAPRCEACPVQRWCRAFEAGRVDEYPSAKNRKRPRVVRQDVVAVRCNGRWLVQQRDGEGMWAGMWQLPTRESSHGPLRAWVERTAGTIVTPLRRIGQFNHATTHRTVRFVVWTCQANPMHSPAWRTLAQVHRLPMGNPQRRAVRMVREAAP